MHLQETILATGLPDTGPGLISVIDIQTGTTLASFKQTNTAARSTALVASTSSQGGFILAAQVDKSILNVYNFQKDQIALKVVLPEKLTCLVVDRKGNYCAGGTAQGRIYLWEIASGILFHAWDAHYRQVTVLKFTCDGLALVSGSEDSGISVWSVSRLVDNELQHELPEPFCALSDHTLPITDICCGIGPFPKCRLLTSSLDHSVKLWDVASRTLLATFLFPKPIAHIAWDITERLFFSASTSGSIYQVNLFQKRESNSGFQTTEAVGGPEHIRIGEGNREANKKELIEVGESVSSLTISLTASSLLAGTDVGSIHIFDVPSHQRLRTINVHKSLAITHLAIMLKPLDLIGHLNSTVSSGVGANSKELIPVKPIVSFQKTKDPKTREAHEVSILFPLSYKPNYDISFDSMEQLLKDQAAFLGPVTSKQVSIPLESKVANLEAEVGQLRRQLQNAKGVNDMMWDTVVQRVLARDKQDHPDTIEPKRKKTHP